MRLFVTSARIVGAFGPLSAADDFCTTAALSANKGGTWKAWLSTASTAAPSRIANVGPWVQEFADGGTLLTFNNRANLQTTPLAALSVDEQGRTYTGARSFWTGTAPGGVIDATCYSWTSTAYAATYGVTGTTSDAWTDSSIANCDGVLSLLCLEQSHLPLQAASVAERRMFVTSTRIAGNFGSLAAADSFCTTAAQAANRTGTWKAFVSASGVPAPSRMTNVGPWVQQFADGGTTYTFRNRFNLMTTPIAPITVDEQGRTFSTAVGYWTGTGSGGLVDATCYSWTSTAYAATYGVTGSLTTTWTNSSIANCDSTARLLCLEQ